MKKTFSNIGVDAGLILITDKAHYNEYDFNFDKNLSKSFKLENGMYYIKWKIDNTYNGDISGSGPLSVTTGEIIISDPCYCVGGNMWDKWLDDTNYGHDTGQNVCINRMGGDGVYGVEIKFIKQKETELNKNEEEIGKQLAEILMLKRSRTSPDKVLTTWGDKSYIGLYKTVKRIIENNDV